MSTQKVTFRSKSPWQKDGCINRSTEHVCENESVIEAVCGNTFIRCCEDEKCKIVAARFAQMGNNNT